MRLTDLLPAAILIGVTVIGITVMSDINQNIFDAQTADTAAYNVSEYGLEGMQELGSWVPTIALVVAASLIIGILVSAFAFGRN